MLTDLIQGSHQSPDGEPINRAKKTSTYERKEEAKKRLAKPGGNVLSATLCNSTRVKLIPLLAGARCDPQQITKTTPKLAAKEDTEYPIFVYIPINECAKSIVSVKEMNCDELVYLDDIKDEEAPREVVVHWNRHIIYEMRQGEKLPSFLRESSWRKLASLFVAGVGQRFCHAAFPSRSF